MTPEEQARLHIYAQFAACGWVVQTKDIINLAACKGMAISEFSFVAKEPDYTLFVDGKAIDAAEAKPQSKTLTCVEDQSAKYLAGLTFGLPPLAEQKRIVAEVERCFGMVEELEAVVAANLQRAARLPQSILQKAFTGDLV
jgi:hypothetical protein